MLYQQKRLFKPVDHYAEEPLFGLAAEEPLLAQSFSLVPADKQPESACTWQARELKDSPSSDRCATLIRSLDIESAILQLASACVNR